MSHISFNNSPAWLVQHKALANVINNQFASLQDVSSYVNVSNFHSFLSGLKQALYWRRKLAPSASSHTAIFSLLSDKGLVLPNVFEICRALKNVCDMTKMVEFYHAHNSSFIGISFSDSSEAEKIRSSFTFFHNSLVIHIIPSSSLTHHFKLMWLPPLFPDARIHHFLDKHSVSHHFHRDLITTDINTHTPSNSVSGTMEFSPQQDILSIPHLIPLPAPHLGSALLIISGRPAFCLRCGSTGHIRRTCSVPRCNSCRHFHSDSSPCSSHSDISSPSASFPWVDFVSDGISDSSVIDSSKISTTECDRNLDASALNPITPDSVTNSPSVSPDVNISSNQFHFNISPISKDAPALQTTPVISSEVPFIVSKRITRSMSSSKRSFPTASHSCTSSPAIDSITTNIFNTLTDEVGSLPATNAAITDVTQPISSTQSHSSSVHTKDSDLFTQDMLVKEDTPSVAVLQTQPAILVPDASITTATEIDNPSSSATLITVHSPDTSDVSVTLSSGSSTPTASATNSKRFRSSSPLSTSSSVAFPLDVHPSMDWATEVEQSLQSSVHHPSIESFPTTAKLSDITLGTLVHPSRTIYSPSSDHHYCEMHCLSCTSYFHARFPLKRDFRCVTCSTNLTKYYYSEHYPDECKVKVIVHISPTAYTSDSFIGYLNELRRLKCHLEIIEPPP